MSGKVKYETVSCRKTKTDGKSSEERHVEYLQGIQQTQLIARQAKKMFFLMPYCCYSRSLSRSTSAYLSLQERFFRTEISTFTLIASPGQWHHGVLLHKACNDAFFFLSWFRESHIFLDTLACVLKLLSFSFCRGCTSQASSRDDAGPGKQVF